VALALKTKEDGKENKKQTTSKLLVDQSRRDYFMLLS
jgi:hypothetical protein